MDGRNIVSLLDDPDLSDDDCEVFKPSGLFIDRSKNDDNTGNDRQNTTNDDHNKHNSNDTKIDHSMNYVNSALATATSNHHYANFISPNQITPNHHPASKRKSIANTANTKRIASALPGASSSLSIAVPAKKKIKKKSSSKAYCLIWVCTHGKGRRSSWRKKDLNIVGIYSDKKAAEEARSEVMSRYDQCGHGDILVGDTWDDEVDLVIREAPLKLDE